jgi:hypothetical protein
MERLDSNATPREELFKFATAFTRALEIVSRKRASVGVRGFSPEGQKKELGAGTSVLIRVQRSQTFRRPQS